MQLPVGFSRDLSRGLPAWRIWTGFLITMLGMLWFVDHMSARLLVRLAGGNIHLAAKTVADSLGEALRERELEITLLSREHQFTSGNFTHPAVRQSFEIRQQLRSELVWLGVADLQGKVVRASGGILEGQSVAGRPWFSAAKKGDHLGDLHEALLLAQHLSHLKSDEPLRLIDFAAPIYDPTGNLIGVLGAHGHWRWITDMVSAVARLNYQDAGLEVMIVDKQGKVLYPKALAGLEQWPLDIPSDEHYAISVGQDGQKYFVSRAPVATRSMDLGWQIVVRQPAAIARQPLEDIRWGLFAIAVIMTLLFAMFMSTMAKGFKQN